jgi:acetolactate decarboxylase
MKKIFGAIIIVLLIILTSFKEYTTNYFFSNATMTHPQTAYQCPMKCEGEKTYSKPGKCPICGMNLAEIKTTSTSPKTNEEIKIIGAMRNVMMKGELQPAIDLDTISNKVHMYGFGPADRLKGELMIIDGKSYLSTVSNKKDMKVVENFDVKAPFFAYENIESWEQLDLPDTILSLPGLEEFLNETSQNRARPFFFIITAISNNSKIHVVNLPGGTNVNSPEDAHIGERSYYIKNKPVKLLGFFSTEHKAIFTHHDTFLHIHLITEDKQQMGHLDSLSLKEGSVKLFLPRYK